MNSVNDFLPEKLTVFYQKSISVEETLSLSLTRKKKNLLCYYVIEFFEIFL